MRFFRKQRQVTTSASPPTFEQLFDNAKTRFDAIRGKIDESSLSPEDKFEAHNVNEAEYRKALEKLICTY